MLRQRLDPDKAAERVYNFLHTLTMEAQMLARACGKTNIHSLEPEDLAALTMEASAMCKVPLAGHQLHRRHRPTITNTEGRTDAMAGTSYKGSEIKDVDQFINDKAGLASTREKEIGQHIGYRYDVNLLPDYSRITPFLARVYGIHGLGRPQLARGRPHGL